MSVLKVENLSYTYNPDMPNRVKALDGINLEIEEGTFVGVIGHTGCGKSTLISHFNGLTKPQEGRILLDGKDIWTEWENIRQVRFNVGMVFQYPEYQLFEETCYKDIAFGPKNMGLSEEEIDSRVKMAAKFCGITDEMLAGSPFDLSGGQKRRIAIAGIIAMMPKVLVLDEPCAGLDPEGRELILSQVKNYQQTTGSTVILVSHSMEDIANYADKVLVMEQGRVYNYDLTENIFRDAENLSRMGLGIPDITKVFLKLKEMGVDIGTDVYTIPYAVKSLLKYKQAKEAEKNA
ncbi:MAG: energy-coupling factor transporter ATPase [Oscillospiraceae bacterium]|nr:energy-coupling factor transporter ATPase [Oscillospiraceae bacterium]MBQ6849509.1 energy-coupling factor transporter ATPase [Oscillospiraceae bacterium]